MPGQTTNPPRTRSFLVPRRYFRETRSTLAARAFVSRSLDTPEGSSRRSLARKIPGES